MDEAQLKDLYLRYGYLVRRRCLASRLHSWPRPPRASTLHRVSDAGGTRLLVRNGSAVRVFIDPPTGG